MIDPLITNGNVSPRGILQSGDKTKKRRFAATGRTQQGAKLPVGHLKRDVI